MRLSDWSSLVFSSDLLWCSFWAWLAVAGAVGVLVALLIAAFPQRSLDQTDWAQLVQFGAILVLLSSGVVYLRRAHLGEALRNLAIWAAIGAALLLGYRSEEHTSELQSLMRISSAVFCL